MNQIEVKLQGETRNVEFDQPILWVDFPVKGFYRSKSFLIAIMILTIGVSIGWYINNENLDKALLESSYYKQEVIRLQHEKIEMQTMLRERGIKGHLIQPEKPIGNALAIKPSKQHIRGR
jgi:predicted Zn-dependent protease